MINRRQVVIVISVTVLLAVVLFVATNPPRSSIQTARPTPTLATPAAGTGGIRGYVSNVSALWQERPVYAYAATFHGDSEGKGIYVLEPAKDPQIRLEADGLLQLNNVPPGPYVLIIGPNPEQAMALRDGGKVRIIQVLANQVADIGTVDLSQ